ncbi:MAG TPA: prefoldin subunit alpha [Candidatus Paceibacterota bacterium]|nr:prefoldin subunit alpha [Candidatus Paceibacterota bacterium]
MDQNEYLMKLYALEQQANQFGEQLQVINQQIEELEKLKDNLKKFERSENKEMFSEFGKGIFIKAKVEKKEFLIDVGNKILVKKSEKEIISIIDEQIKKFESIKPEISKKVEQINKELNKIVEQAQNEKESPKKGDKNDNSKETVKN